MKADGSRRLDLEVCILTGGLSARMGRDKSRLRLGHATMLGHIRATVRQLGFAGRTIRRDSVSRCGPIGGIYTALQRSKAEAVLFLACDMPFVSVKFLQRMMKRLSPSGNAVFAAKGGMAGFPFLLRRENCLPLVSQQIKNSEFSLQGLARILKSTMVRPSRPRSRELMNINTPADLEAARRCFSRQKRL